MYKNFLMTNHQVKIIVSLIQTCSRRRILFGQARHLWRSLLPEAFPEPYYQAIYCCKATYYHLL